jgi:NAD(P)-dependent dehydrogenase (short-subunit alcohol dehydrogenase family)
MSSSKLATIAGYGSGISAAVARRFAAEGYKVALLGLSQEPLDAAAAGK